MRRKRFSEEQIIGILKESEAGAKTKDLCRKHGSDVTFYNWKAKYTGMTVSEARRLRELEHDFILPPLSVSASLFSLHWQLRIRRSKRRWSSP